MGLALFAAVPVAAAAFPSGTAVSPYLLGQNYWYAPPDSAYPLIGTSGVRMIRIGGHAPDVTPYSNAVLLQQVDNIRSIGAEPLIQVSRYQSATVAANTVRYLNVTNARAVKYWSIGNEPDLEWTGTEADLATYVAGYTKPMASAMREVDPTIKISGGDMAWYSTSKFNALLGGSADITGKDAQGRYYIDCITFHRYPFADVITRAGVLDEMHSAYESKVSALVSRIAYANTLQGRTGANALQWGYTEFNMTYKNPATSINNPEGLGVSSFLNGQLFAEYFRVAMKYGAFTTNTWSLLEGGGNGSSTDLGYLGGSWDAPVKRSSFYHMQLFADYLLPGGYLPATSSSPTLAVVSTSTQTQTQLSVMLLNEDTTGSQTFTIRMNDEAVVGAGTKINVSAGLAAEYTGTIDNQSTVVLLFDFAGTLRQKVTYSLARYQQNLPPLVETFSVPPASNLSRLINISTRSLVGTDSDVQIAGFVISGATPKKVVIRASGPVLAANYGVTGVLADPMIELHRTGIETPLATNDDWNAALAPDFAAVGAFAWTPGSKDAALVTTLNPGMYTVIVKGKNGGTGVALVEVYDADTGTPAGRLINISTRSLVGTGDNVQIAGFVVGGSDPKRLVIRAAGPSLAPLGVTGALADPMLELHDQITQAILATNDDWNSTLAGDFAAVGAFAWTPGSKDAALVTTLNPGMYTVIVKGKNDTTGVALVEVYEEP